MVSLCLRTSLGILISIKNHLIFLRKFDKDFETRDNIDRKSCKNSRKYLTRRAFVCWKLLILFAQFWGALFVVGLAGTLLAKIHLLPAALYVMIVKTVAPAWVEAEHIKYLLILAALILYAILRWALWFYRRCQEERAARGYLLATARPMYEITEDGQYIPIHYDD